MFLSRLTNQADEVVERFVFGVWNTFHTTALPVLEWVLAVAVALVGYQLWTGATSLRDLWPKAMRFGIVFALVAANSPLERALYQLVTEVPEAVGSMLTQAIRPRKMEQVDPSAPSTEAKTPVSLTADLDTLLENTGRAAGRMVGNAGWSSLMSPMSVIWGAILITVTALFLGAVAIVVMISKLAVGILLALAPFAVLMLFFDSTRSLFEGWLRQLLGFALAPVFLFSLLGLMMSLITDFSEPIVRPGEQAAALPAFLDLGPYLAIMAAAIGLTTQVVSWASGVAGSVALSVSKALPGPSAAAAAARTLQAGLRAVAQAPDVATKAADGSVQRNDKGNVSEPRRVRQAAVNTRAFAEGAARYIAGLRPPRAADSSWRPPAASPPPAPRPNAAQESVPAARGVRSESSAPAAERSAAAGGTESSARPRAQDNEAAARESAAAPPAAERVAAAGGATSRGTAAPSRTSGAGEPAAAGSGVPPSASSAGSASGGRAASGGSSSASERQQGSASISSSTRVAPPPRARGERKE